MKGEREVTDLLRGGIQHQLADGSFLALESGTLDIGVLTADESKGASIAGVDECYRYDLYRRWGHGPMLGWIMLNPSTADALKDDHTIGRCKYYARREGFEGIVVRNLFAYRTPHPPALRAALEGGVDVVGPDNDGWLRSLFDTAEEEPETIGQVVAAWGSAGRWAWPRIETVEGMMFDAGITPLALGVTATGQPRHPSRLPNDVPLTAYPP